MSQELLSKQQKGRHGKKAWDDEASKLKEEMQKKDTYNAHRRDIRGGRGKPADSVHASEKLYKQSSSRKITFPV